MTASLRPLARLTMILLAGLALALGGARPAWAQEPAFDPTRFSVEVSGEGPDVNFIPGLATSRGVWADAAAELGSGYRVHLVQVKGFGEPAGPNAQGPVLAPLVEELARYIADNGIERPAIVGHSLGGLMALMLGADHPALPGKLLIVDAFPWLAVPGTPSGEEVTVAMIEAQVRPVRDAIVASHGTPAADQPDDSAIAGFVVDQGKLPRLREWTGGADQRVFGQLLYEDLITDWRERIADITAPLTLIYPWNERNPTRAEAEPFYRASYAKLPGARLVGIGPAAHFVMTDQPVAFQAALEGFLRD
jgi:pimeloyl-ACP methyl ester carboxylesterase